MGRRYDEEARPRREWKGMRFLVGLVFGIAVAAVGLMLWSANAPNPLHPEAERAAAAPAEASGTAGSAAPAPSAPAQSLAGDPAPQPAPSVSAPGQPEPQDTSGPVAPETNLDSAVEGDFSSDDTEVALRQPGAAPQPVPSVSIGGTPDNPGLQLEGPALEVNAIPFDASGGTPLVAVVLSGAGDTDLTSETLLSLAMPLTLALAPQGQADTRLAAEAKLAGYEVVAELPVRAEAGSDALSLDMSEVDLADRVAALLSRLWMSVGAMPRFEDGTRADDRFSRAFIAVLERNGFAYVTAFDGPVDEAQAVADAFGVPFVAGDVSLGADVTADGAYAALERAAATARSRGSAVLRGPVSRAMLEGLLRWSLEKSGREARIAPLSAVLAAPGAATAGAE